MVVRIRLSYGGVFQRAAIAHRRAALVASSLLSPIAVMAGALGCWRIAADLKWTGEFAITRGLFSHWQVWIALAVAVQFAAFLLHRYGRQEAFGEDDAALP